MKSFIYLFSILFFLSNTAFSQEKENNNDKSTLKEKFEAANSLMEDHLYEFAKEIWLELYKADSLNANINFKTGYCILNTAHDKKEAFKYFDFASGLNALPPNPITFPE